MLDRLNRPRDFDLRKITPVVFGMIVDWSPWYVQHFCSWNGAEFRFSYSQISFILSVETVMGNLMENELYVA